MKDLILMLLQLIGVVCFLGFIFSLLNIAFGWNIGFKGAAVPADIRATLSFLAVAGICAAVVYFWGEGGANQEKSPD